MGSDLFGEGEPDLQSSRTLTWSSPVGMRPVWLKRPLLTLVALSLVLFLVLVLKGGFEGTVKTHQQHLQNPRMTRSFANLEANISSICELIN